MKSRFISLILVISMLVGILSACDVINKDDGVQYIKFGKTEYSVYVGDRLTLDYSVFPATPGGDDLRWNSSDESVAVVAGGIIYGKSEGVTAITAQSSNGVVGSCVIRVVAIGDNEPEEEKPDEEKPEEKPNDQDSVMDGNYFAVMPGAKGFVSVDISGYSLPSTVVEVCQEKSGLGYVVKLDTRGYSNGLVIVVGVDMSGVVTGATCVSSNETWGIEQTFGDKTVGKDIDSIVDLEAGATSLTVNGYRSAVKDAIIVATILSGGSVDLRSEEEKFADALSKALPAGDTFTRVFLVEFVDVFDAIYESNNGAGYVCVIGSDSTGTFVGVGSNGVAIGESEYNEKAEDAVALIRFTTLYSIDVSDYKVSDDREVKRIFRQISSMYVTASGNYVVEINANGYSDDYIVIKVSVSEDGTIIDNVAVSNSELIGKDYLEYGEFNSNFLGKTHTEADCVDTVAGATVTTDAYKTAILRVFNAIDIIKSDLGNLLPDTGLNGVSYNTGSIMHDFTVTTTDGKAFTLSEVLKEKKAVLINFWYVECYWCQYEFPYLQAAYEEYQDDIAVIALNPFTDYYTLDEITQFKEYYGLTFDVAFDDIGLDSAFSVEGYPTSVLIDRYGVVTLIHEGAIIESGVFEELFAYYTADDYVQEIKKSW